MLVTMSGGDMADLYKQLIAADMGLTLIYQDKSTSEQMELSFSVDQLKESVSKNLSIADRNKLQYDIILQRENASCPMVVTDGLILTGIKDEPNYKYLVKIN